VLAEASGGWSATLSGKPLTALAAPVDGWEQGFVLPPGGGHLIITRHEMARDISLGCEAAALLVVFALALPGTRSPAADADAVPAGGRRREGGEGTSPARRERRPEPALVGVTAGGAASADDAHADPGPAAGAEGAPFGLEPGPEYGADADYGASTEPGQSPAYAQEPTLGVMPHLEEGHPPWADIATGIPDGTAPDDQDPGPASRPAPPRRGRGGQHTARHGKSSRRRGGSEDPGDGS
jgi:hypothetical protein